MALHIIRSGHIPPEIPQQWHLNDNVRPVQRLVASVAEVMAEGTELEYIIARFGSTIPRVYMIQPTRFDGSNPREAIQANFPPELGLNPRSMRWFGDHARFIIANL